MDSVSTYTYFTYLLNPLNERVLDVQNMVDVDRKFTVSMFGVSDNDCRAEENQTKKARYSREPWLIFMIRKCVCVCVGLCITVN